MTLLESNPTRKLLVGLTACLLQQIEDPVNGVDRPCAVNTIPGEYAMPEYQGDCQKSHTGRSDQPVHCGLGWVRLVRAYMASGVGVQDNSAGNCNASLGLELNIGITRCFDPGMDPLKTPSVEQTAEVTMATVADMLVMLKAIRCCDVLTSKDYTVGGYIPIGPAGGMTGGSWTVSVVL